MREPNSFRAIIELWHSREAMAADVGASAWQVSKWWQRRSIPSEWWSAILSSDVGKSAGVTAEQLTTLAARSPGDEAGLTEARA